MMFVVLLISACPSKFSSRSLSAISEEKTSVSVRTGQTRGGNMKALYGGISAIRFYEFYFPGREECILSVLENNV